MSNVVTFTITLPVCAFFKETVDALKAAREAQAKIGNMDAAQALHVVVVLAEGGMHLHNTATSPVVLPVADR